MVARTRLPEEVFKPFKVPGEDFRRIRRYPRSSGSLSRPEPRFKKRKYTIPLDGMYSELPRNLFSRPISIGGGDTIQLKGALGSGDAGRRPLGRSKRRPRRPRRPTRGN